MKDFFKELKVVEIASVLAGPATGLFFAELGAKVIKIENNKTGGDVTRSWKLASEDSNDPHSAYYYSVNLLKEVVFADFSVSQDLKMVLGLIKDSDIVIVNFKKGDDKKFGLDHKTLSALNKGIIYASISGFGNEDERLAYDLILQAESGFMSMNGTPESGPLKMPVALIDLMAAHQLKEGILLALLHKMKTGIGARVSVSLYDAARASLANQASNWLNAGFLPGLQGSLHPNIAPYGEIFLSSDNCALTFAIGNDKQFFSLCDLLQKPELKEAESFHSNKKRVENRLKLKKILSAGIKLFTIDYLRQNSIKNQIPFAEIKKLDKVLDGSCSEELFIQKKIGEKNIRTVKSFIATLNINN
ncbi:MAG: CoA transferase [Bacteroidia bacterium]|nr:CoA transferase [Bacteroidia bacterium]